MKRILALSLPLVLALALGATAQDTSNSNGNSQATTPSTNSYPSQSASQSESQSSSNAATSENGNETFDGCIVREQTTYYLQPANGGERMRLNSNEDLSSSVGHHVRIQGKAMEPSAASAASTNPSEAQTHATAPYPNGTQSPNSNGENNSQNEASEAGSSGAQNGQVIDVTKVETVSSTCPTSTGTGTNENTTPPQR